MKKAGLTFLFLLIVLCFITSCNSNPAPEMQSEKSGDGAFRIGNKYFTSLSEAVVNLTAI